MTGVTDEPTASATPAESVEDHDPVGSEREQLRPDTWPELQPALDAGVDWGGSLSGRLFRGGETAPWELCRVMLESLPPQCEDGLVVDPAPAIVDRSPNLFERFGDVWLSQETLSVDGTFVFESLMFREDPTGKSANDLDRFDGYDVSVGLPNPGRAVSTFTLLGPLWTVRHQDGSASAIPGWVADHTLGDEYGLEGVGELVSWSADVRQFRAGQRFWDEWGRPLTADTTPLSLLDASINRDQVRIVQNSTTADDSGDDAPAADAQFDTPQLPNATSLVHANLTAGWVLVDAALVFRGSDGWLCDIDATVPVDELVVCGNPDGTESDFARSAASTSSRPDLFVWMFGPVLYHFGPDGHLAIPTGSTNDRPAVLDATDIHVAIESAQVECAYAGGIAIDLAVTTTWQTEVLFRIAIDDELVLEHPWYVEPGQLQGVYLPSSPAGDGIITNGSNAIVTIVAADNPAIEMARTTVALNSNCE